MATPSAVSVEGSEGGMGDVWRVSAGFLTINLNGWGTDVGKSLRRKTGQPQVGQAEAGYRRFQALFAAIGRHKVSLVAIQEHHWRNEKDFLEAQFWLQHKGWGVVATWGESGDGVAFLWKLSDWDLVLSCAL